MSRRIKMKITIIVFSPSGNTLAIAKLIKKSFLSRNSDVQVLDLTRKKEITCQNSIENFLKEKGTAHDILFIGGPVYSGHLQESVKNIIKALPSPNDKWSSLAIPFVTYGGIHSSIALKESGELLKKSGRKNIFGLKIATSHSLVKRFSFNINENKPGDEELQIIKEATEKTYQIINKKAYEIEDRSNSFSYSGFFENLFYKIFSEKTLHKIMFSEINIDPNKCTGCGICVKRCPLQIIEIKEKKAVKSKNNSQKCCYCSECYHNCNVYAISLDLSKPEKYLSSMKNKNKFESPQSSIYA